MKRLLTSLLLGSLLAGPSFADDPKAKPDCAPSDSGRTVPYVNLHLKENQEPTCIPDLKLTEDSKKEKLCEVDVFYKEEKVEVEEIELKARPVEKEITCLVFKEVEEVDPCTGKKCLVLKQVPEKKKVTVTEYEKVPVKRTVIVRRPCLKTVTPEVQMTRFCLHDIEVVGIKTSFELVPVEKSLPVPECPPREPCPSTAEAAEMPCDAGCKPGLLDRLKFWKK